MLLLAPSSHPLHTEFHAVPVFFPFDVIFSVPSNHVQRLTWFIQSHFRFVWEEEKMVQMTWVPAELLYKVLLMRRKGHKQVKALTRVFTPYCFSTFSRNCLKQASMRSWKGLSASVTFSPWMRTPSARCGICRGKKKKKKEGSIRKLYPTYPGEMSA